MPSSGPQRPGGDLTAFAACRDLLFRQDNHNWMVSRLLMRRRHAAEPLVSIDCRALDVLGRGTSDDGVREWAAERPGARTRGVRVPSAVPVGKSSKVH